MPGRIIDEGAALWRKSRADVTEQDLKEFYRHLGHLWPRVSLLRETALEMPQKCVYLWQEPSEETNVECPARGSVAHIAHDP